jgi:uncharacterized membrane protein
MNIVLWLAQVLLAAVYTMAGVMKVSQPKEKLASRLPWVEDFAPGTVHFIGVVELLGATGLIVPAATGIAPVLTPVAASALGLVMLLAALTHVRRKEPGGVVLTLTLLALNVFVAWGRFGPYGF